MSEAKYLNEKNIEGRFKQLKSMIITQDFKLFAEFSLEELYQFLATDNLNLIKEDIITNYHGIFVKTSITNRFNENEIITAITYLEGRVEDVKRENLIKLLDIISREVFNYEKENGEL